MRDSFVCLFVLLLAAVTVPCNAQSDVKSQPPRVTPDFAVVELFTSEGCSSCPPADELLSRIVARSAERGDRVVCLSFHVDYWDDLGWKDPFSSKDFTHRQNDYANAMSLRTIYTPQMIVNGTEQFVGSDASHAERAIGDALRQKSVATIQLDARADGQRVIITHKVSGAPAGAVLNLAWVQSSATSKPTRGENGGRDLKHVNVVRDFRVVALSDKAAAPVTLRRTQNDAGMVVAYVQEAGTGRVIGATTATLRDE
jgi:hypothetical protein